MNGPTYFFLILFATLILTRILLLRKTVHSPTVLGLRLHHYMYGIILIILAIIFSNLTLYAIGWALFIDELPQLLTKAWTWQDYYSIKNGLWVLALIALLFIFRNALLSVFS